MGILGGELWWIRDEKSFFMSIPQREGQTPFTPGQTIASKMNPDSTTSNAGLPRQLRPLRAPPGPDDLPTELPGKILYNLTFVPEGEFEQLKSRR
jgi:hypothetical protein